MAYEQYFRGNNQATKCISWSVGKSVVSALFGIAVAEGKIKSIESQTVTDFVPELKGSGYDGVRLKDVLQMSSGVAFNEDYGSFFSDINRMGRTLAFGGSIQAFVKSLKREIEPGTKNHYISMDTQALGLVLRAATGMTLTEYLQEKLWPHVGMEADVRWSLDNEVDQMELAFGTLHAVTRDYARFGWLYLNQGKSPLDGKQLIPMAWVKDSVTPDAPHLQPGDHGHPPWGLRMYEPHDPALGYGYQFWIPGHPDDIKNPSSSKLGGEYMAIGVYNQFIYVSPEHGVVIAKNSAYPFFNDDDNEEQSIEAFRAIAAKFSLKK